MRSATSSQKRYNISSTLPHIPAPSAPHPLPLSCTPPSAPHHPTHFHSAPHLVPLITPQVLWSPDGSQLSIGTWRYKPPGPHDIPLQFNVSFLANSPNPAPNATLGAKAVSQTALHLAAAAFFAARQAIRSVRADSGVQADFDLDAPLTVEKLQQACLVSPSQFVLQ